MKPYLLTIVLICFSFSTFAQQQQFQPEDVVHTVNGHQLKYKHVLAYIDMEMYGEDPAQLNSQEFVKELTTECLEEFAEDPAFFVEEMNTHYQAIQMGAGNLNRQQPAVNNYSREPVQPGNQNFNQGQVASGGSWKQLLSGSVLYYSATQSHDGIFVQSTQYLHLCPNGTALFYEESGGGGGPITAPRQTQFTGSANWDIVEQGTQAYLRMTLQGRAQNFPMQVINQKLQVQGLGTFSVQAGAAQCY